MALKFVGAPPFADYLTATVGHVSYTIVGPRVPVLASPYPGVELEQYTHPEKWTASRMPNDDFLSAIVGNFYLARYDNYFTAVKACTEDYRAIERVQLWFEFMKLNDPRQLMPGWRPE